MKQTLLFAALGLVGVAATAQEVGQVLSSTPVVQQVAVPRQVCGQPVMVQQQTTGGGGLLGAIAGAAIGSQIGGGSGRVAGLMAGTVGGALLGNHIEANGRTAQAVPQCTTETTYENRTVAWNVTYEYGGREYQTQMPYDPGPTIRLQVTPVGSNDAAPAPALAGAPGGPVVVAPGMHSAPPVYVPAPAPVVYQQMPVYPAAPVYQAYPPIGISLGIGYSRGWGGHHHRRHYHRH